MGLSTRYLGIKANNRNSRDYLSESIQNNTVGGLKKKKKKKEKEKHNSNRIYRNNNNLAIL